MKRVSKTEDTLLTIGAILIVVLGFILSFFVTAGLYWCVTWAFDFAFDWKHAFGVWIIIAILKMLRK